MSKAPNRISPHRGPMFNEHKKRKKVFYWGGKLAFKIGACPNCNEKHEKVRVPKLNTKEIKSTTAHPILAKSHTIILQWRAKYYVEKLMVEACMQPVLHRSNIYERVKKSKGKGGKNRQKKKGKKGDQLSTSKKILLDCKRILADVNWSLFVCLVNGLPTKLYSSWTSSLFRHLHLFIDPFSFSLKFFW